ncbi:MAG: single-stranded DNA-binding protein [Vallitaleaceae bacterium]|nr:single-stranded DNA-binding protein [Vallitaleaceae bacterium]
MDESIIRNNQVNIIGEISSGFEFSHEVYGEGFFNFDVLVPRLSENEDIIPITVSERLIDIHTNHIGEIVDVSGQFRSYNRHLDGKNRLVLTVFARELTLVGDEEIVKNPNSIFLDGYICKPPLYRTTPFGREITDVLIAVNRPYNKSDYIPCICWGRNAKYASEFKVGQKMRVWGRVQSRSYQKRVGDEQYVQKVAYEVSISKIEKDEL